MNSFGLIAERNAVKDFSDYLGCLRHSHSRAVEEEVPVRKRDVAVLQQLPKDQDCAAFSWRRSPTCIC